MARRKQEMESTPEPVSAVFPISESLTGRLTGNAFDGSASLDIFYKLEDESGHMSIDGLNAIAILAHELTQFVHKMQSKGTH